MAAKHGISHQTVAEIWRAFGLKPWRQDEFKISPDPQLVDKIRDIVGLYMNPPVNVAVFAVDEKPQIQALNRTAPMLPMMPTTAQRRSHDYRRNGTIDLFAALDIASGKVITELRPNHTSTLFIRFLNKINREVPDHLDVHVILDNLSTNKTPAVHRWLLVGGFVPNEWLWVGVPVFDPVDDVGGEGVDGVVGGALEFLGGER